MTKLILGCGYLGGRVAERWLAAGHSVVAVTRSFERAADLRQRGIEPIVAEVTKPETLAGLPAAESVVFAVGFDARSGKSRRQVYVDGLQATLDALPAETGRVIFISSTGVYGNTDGDWVDEDMPCHPTREAGQALLAAEDVLLRHPLGRRAIVLRMAGMYGRGRWPRRDELMAGRPITARADSWLNLIHVDDAAAIVEAAGSAEGDSPIFVDHGCAAVPAKIGTVPTYVVSDGHPVMRREFLAYLAQQLAAPPPRFLDPSAEFLATHHSGSNKRVRNAKMLTDLKVTLLYPSYREGLAANVD